MRFEELLALVEKFNGEAGYATGGYVDNLVYSGLDVHLMLEEIKSGIEQLQETYGPKIKMTKAQFDWFTIAIDLYDKLEDILGHRWETPTVAEDGYNDRVREIRLLDDKTLALAWLHPELIEVTDD